jgi:hypothetical protein
MTQMFRCTSGQLSPLYVFIASVYTSHLSLSVSPPSLPSQLLFAHATQPRLYYTLDEGDSFMITDITSVNINPRTLLYHPDQDGWMMAQDTSSAVCSHPHNSPHSPSSHSIHITFALCLFSPILCNSST